MTADAMEEARILGRYLLRKDPSAKCIDLYAFALGKKDVLLNAREERIFRFMMKHPLFIGAIDSALAFRNSNSKIRLRILIMSAILETQPEYADMFLPKKTNSFYNIYIIGVGMRGVMKMMAGKMILLFF